MSSPTGANLSSDKITGYKQRNISTLNPQQQQLFQKLADALLGGGGLGGGVDYLSKLASGDEGIFGEIEAPAYRQLQSQLGQIGSRFADVGAVGSSGFQQTASGAATDLGERLQSQRNSLRSNAIKDLLGLSENLIGQKTFEPKFQKEFNFKQFLGELAGKLDPEDIAKILKFVGLVA